MNPDDRGRSDELSSAYEALQAKSDEILRDLEAARRVQRQMLPQAADLPQQDDVEFAGWYRSHGKVGGDFYDFLRVGMNSWGFLIADVSGHGLPSALLTMFLQAAFRTRLRWGVAADQVCRQVNDVLHPVVGDLGLFVTAFFAIIDLETGTLRYTSCGHPSAYLRRASGAVVPLGGGGMILGPFDEVELEQQVLSLEEGDVLLAVTDGVLEARNYQGDLYGADRLAEALGRLAPDPQHPAGSLAGALEALRRELEAFNLGAGFDDDLSLAAFRFRRRAPRKGHEPSDLDLDRDRRDLQLASALRRRSRAAYRSGNPALVLSLADALEALGCDDHTDGLLRSLALRKLGRNAEARAAAESALAGLVPGSPRELLARRILGTPRN